MEPVSALPGCVLEMTLKSSCSQAAPPRLSLRGNSEERDRRGSAAAPRLSAGQRAEGSKESKDRTGARDPKLRLREPALCFRFSSTSST